MRLVRFTAGTQEIAINPGLIHIVTPKSGADSATKTDIQLLNNNHAAVTVDGAYTDILDMIDEALAG